MENLDENSKLSNENEGPARKRFKQFVIDEHSDNGFKSLQALRSDQHLFDVKLEVDGLTMSAHKLVLAAISPYFRAMFTGE